MTIELTREQRAQALASIERYFRENMDEPIGNVAAAGLLGFFMDELGGLAFNQGVARAQAQMQARIAEVDIDVHEDEFGHWSRSSRAAKPARR